ncbi:hypothetical protein Mia14_0792 [Candidatus Mancarchaeum acidiphilum]|uniref:Uncharacterized protein n=1 Tax=Candidatus Mancarchaeum acidiphilum TaxID=1920749 RepID=A0A218NNQ8_9ARCH|nr:hypothetical protein Mia14_0792 [Candidatus Mancarchaeum acidiphilum]
MKIEFIDFYIINALNEARNIKIVKCKSDYKTTIRQE